jgi:hypothetical protein
LLTDLYLSILLHYFTYNNTITVTMQLNNLICTFSFPFSLLNMWVLHIAGVTKTPRRVERNHNSWPQQYCDVSPKKPAYPRFIARQQLRKYATVLEPLLGSGPRATMEVQLEAVFSTWSAPRLYHSIDRVPISSVSSRQGDGNEVIVPNSSDASKQATRKGAPVQPVERDKKNNRTSDCDDCNCKGVGQ